MEHKEWVITDTHWGHENIKSYCGRPDDFENRIIQAWQQLVAPCDTVYHLGDVCFGWSQKKLKSVLNVLPGTKILLRGNHDGNKSNVWFRNAGFAAVARSIELGTSVQINESERSLETCRVVLCHYPMEVHDEVDIMLHGHCHDRDVTKIVEYKDILDVTEKHLLLSLEAAEYRPVLLSKIWVSSATFQWGSEDVSKTLAELTEIDE